VRNVLVDAGPLVALFNVSDRYHRHFDLRIRTLAQERLTLLTTWPCVTEATHMLRVLDNRLDLMLWIAAGGVHVHEFLAEELATMAEWMRGYAVRRREMDLADASLILLATARCTNEILTVDVNDFERYRLPSGGHFQLL
jgi:uncharacterized protein